MTDTELVTIVFDGLIAQGGCSVTEHYECMYRSPNGRKCAAGLLIKDEDYDVKFELNVCYHITYGGGIVNKISNLLTSYGYEPEKVRILQILHDNIANMYNTDKHVIALNYCKEKLLSHLSNDETLLTVDTKTFCKEWKI